MATKKAVVKKAVEKYLEFPTTVYVGKNSYAADGLEIFSEVESLSGSESSDGDLIAIYQRVSVMRMHTGVTLVDPEAEE